MVSTLSIVSPKPIPEIVPVIHNNPNFKAKQTSEYAPKDVKVFPDRTEIVYETEASSGKKWGVGIASAFLPGLGQAINGQWGKGFAFLAGFGVPQFIGTIAGLKGNVGTALLATGVTLGSWVWSIVDAVKSARSEQKVIMPKQPEVAQQVNNPQTLNYTA